MSLVGFIQGWPHCRLVIVVDGTFIKMTYRGLLLSACAMDTNEQIFPLVFGVGPLKSNDLLEFFFTKLKEAIRDRDDLAIISDRNKGIQNPIKKVYPNAHHGFCMQHFARNVTTKCKTASKAVHWNFVKVVKAYTLEEWERYMNFLNNTNVRIHPYIKNDVGHEKWARSYINNKQYSMISNNSESMNVVDKRLGTTISNR